MKGEVAQGVVAGLRLSTGGVDEMLIADMSTLARPVEAEAAEAPAGLRRGVVDDMKPGADEPGPLVKLLGCIDLADDDGEVSAWCSGKSMRAMTLLLDGGKDISASFHDGPMPISARC